jgi:hypothetical protein
VSAEDVFAVVAALFFRLDHFGECFFAILVVLLLQEGHLLFQLFPVSQVLLCNYQVLAFGAFLACLCCGEQ